MNTPANGIRLEAVELGRSFGSMAVLVGLNLRASPGEFVAVIGRSGSGKSTLLRTMAGLDRADRGEVRLDGRPIDGPNPNVRILFQDGRLLPWLRVGANVELGLAKVDRAKATQLLVRVGLADRADDWPAILSGGQRQRVALARALVAEPRMLLLDEPLGSLDALTRIEMQRLVEAVWLERRFTAVLVTHDVAEAVALADRVVLLESGRVAAEWSVPHPRPRTASDANLAGLVEKILSRVLRAEEPVK